MQIKRTYLGITCLVALSLLFFCSARAREDRTLDFKRFDYQLMPYGYVSQDHLWHDPIVSVCWENPTPANAQARLLIEQSVEDTWEKYVSIQFTGWGNACQPKVHGVHIFIIDESASPRSLIGTRLDGVSNGVRLNTTFANWNHEYCGTNVESCTRTVAVHEWGHVLGFIHESLRDDAPQWCKSSSQVLQDDSDPGDGKEVTPYDPNSIMNYCTLIYGRQTALSALDIKAAQLLYPKLQ